MRPKPRRAAMRRVVVTARRLKNPVISMASVWRQNADFGVGGEALLPFDDDTFTMGEAGADYGLLAFSGRCVKAEHCDVANGDDVSSGVESPDEFTART